MDHIVSYYNGYRFCEEGQSVFNPWSTLKFLKSGKLENYWYEPGSPSLLINQMLADPDRFEIENHEIKTTKHDLMHTESLPIVI